MPASTISKATRPSGHWGTAPVSTTVHADHIPVRLLVPPYGPEDVRPAPAEGAGEAAPGTIVGLLLDRPDVDVESLGALALEQIRRSPTCPVVALLQVPLEAQLRLANRLAPLSLRAVVPRGPGMRAILAETLTDQTRLPGDVVAWLRIRGVRLNPGVEALLEQIFALAPAYPELAPLLARCGVAASTARWRMHKKRLPAPARWFQAARALHAALRLQAEPEASTPALAHAMGFADHSALAHLLRRSLGVTSQEIRGTLGWAWLLDRWLQRSGRSG